MIDKYLQEAELKPLFQKEALFISTCDVITEDRVEKLLGKKALEHAKSLGRAGEDYNLYGVDKGEYSIKYLYYRGFLKAVSYHNIELLRQTTEEA